MVFTGLIQHRQEQIGLGIHTYGDQVSSHSLQFKMRDAKARIVGFAEIAQESTSLKTLPRNLSASIPTILTGTTKHIN